MRYNDRITLVYMDGPEDELTGEVISVKKRVTCCIQPVTNLQKLNVYGLLKTSPLEVHLKNRIDIPDRVEIAGVQHNVIEAIKGRKVRVLTIGG